MLQVVSCEGATTAHAVARGHTSHRCAENVSGRPWFFSPAYEYLRSTSQLFQSNLVRLHRHIRRSCTDPSNFWCSGPQQVHIIPPTVNEAQSSNTMTTIHNRVMRPSAASIRTTESVLAFLLPSAPCIRSAPAARFSTSPIRCRKDNNSNRGVSAVRGTGLRRRQTLSVLPKKDSRERIPKPVPITEKVTGTADHGLWDFFKEKQLLQTPVDESRHGICYKPVAALASG